MDKQFLVIIIVCVQREEKMGEYTCHKTLKIIQVKKTYK